MKTISSLRNEIEAWKSLQRQIHDLTDLANMGDESLRADMEAEFPNSKPTLKNARLR
jgi:hypothetical protein